MKMNTALTVVATVTAALFAQASFAQTSPTTRAEVKAETKAAGVNKGPEGEALGMPVKPAPTTSTESRGEVKAETKAGPKLKAGEAPGGEARVTGSSSKTRAERKAETRAAKMNGQLEPAGERSPTATSKTKP